MDKPSVRDAALSEQGLLWQSLQILPFFCFSNSSHFAEVNFLSIHYEKLFPGLTLLFQD